MIENKSKIAVGICMGASSVSAVKAEKNFDGRIVVQNYTSDAHNGDPKKILNKILNELNAKAVPVVVTGRKFRHLVNLAQITEPEAVELAFAFHNKNSEDYSAIAGLGGETFLVYNLDKTGKIESVISKNQCASGTGEFFLQQIKRMDLNLDEATDISVGIDPFKVSGRCSVFCKSDCTHALNKGVSQAEVASGLALMMSEKVEELLQKTRPGKVLIVGGVSKNKTVMNFLSKRVGNIDVPEYAASFEALGAALYALDNTVASVDSYDDIYVKNESSFVFHESLEKFSHMVSFEEAEPGKASDGDDCILGLDVGSTTTKAVVIRESDDKVLGSVYLYTHGNPVTASRKCYAELLKQIPQKINIKGIGVTGSGRQIAGLHALTDGVVNEIIAHAAAAVYYDPEVDTIFEIGGQDAKYTYIVNRVPADYAMNEACSAGTGSFIEESAFESLGIKVEDIQEIAMQGKTPPNFSDQCAAFIGSDIKTALQENISKEDIVAGLVYSICLNYVNRVKGNRQTGKKVFMQGGVCYNKAIPTAMAALTGKNIIVPPDPGMTGAFGVALVIKEKIQNGRLKASSYSLNELAGREVEFKSAFICAGGKEKCDRKCEINRMVIRGETYPFGGACNMYYNMRSGNPDFKTDDFDFVKKRQELTFDKFTPKQELPANAPTVGINLSYHTHTLYPLYYHFFNELGMRIVLSDTIEAAGLEREQSSLCFPGQLSLGLFQDLLNKGADYYFVPEILEMYTEDAEHNRIDFNCTCAFLNAEPLILKQAFKDYNLKDKLIMPLFNFADGYAAQEDKFIETANLMGIRDIELIKKAHDFAVKKWNEYQESLYELGRDFMKILESDPEASAVVLVGRPYNSFTDTANKGIPRKFASRAVYIVPYDIFDYRNEEIDDDQYWESAKKILKVSKFIKRHPQLFATYITNFSCAPDSMTLTTFRSLMGTKPSLTLELDGHTADAGINTRIDAALDIIANYRAMSERIKDPDYSDFNPAFIEVEGENSFYVTSDGDRIPLNDPRVEIVIPSMGDLSTKMFTSAMRSLGLNAVSLPEGNHEILKYARANATGKECLPVLLIVGSLIDYIENTWDGEKYIVCFLVQGAGNCRVGQYPVFLRDLIMKKKMKNVATLALANEEAFAGLGSNFEMRAAKGLMAADVLEDVRAGILTNAVDPVHGEKVFNREFEIVLESYAQNPENLFADLKRMAKSIKREVPAGIPIEESKYINMVGEIYTRREHFSHKNLDRYFAKRGFILKTAYVTEWVFYVDHLINIGLLEPDDNASKKRDRFLRNIYMRYVERRTKKLLEKSGFYEYMKIDINALLDHSKHVIPLEYKGEPGMTLGAAMHEILDRYCGVINLGPFGCMPTRCAESFSLPEMKVENKLEAKRNVDPKYTLPSFIDEKLTLPFLTIESDGNVYPQVTEARLETFTLQAERIHQLMLRMKKKK